MGRVIRGIYTAVSGMIVNEAKQGVISNNLSNAGTIGYKGQDLSSKSFKEVMLKNYDKIENNKNVANKIGSMSFGTEIDEVNTRFTQGNFKQTDKQTDFALEGPGFFTVERMVGDENQLFYTRNGNFNVDLSGYLVNSNGDKVMGKNSSTGRLESIYVGNSSLYCNEFGEISIDGEKKYTLNVVDFEDYKQLEKVGDNNFKTDEEPLKGSAFVRQGSIEMSNINITNEYVNMMTIYREFEGGSKVIQTLNETLGKSVNDLGRVK